MTAEPPRTADPRRPVILITGLSGAGLSTGLKALEDLGYETVDNLRLILLSTLVNQADERPLAIRIDSRTRGFTADSMLRELGQMKQNPGLDVRLVFLEASEEVLQRRYTETRRPHPMALDRRISDGISLERSILWPLRDHADLVIDSSDISVHDIRRILQGHFRLDAAPDLQIFVSSFAYRHGVPREADLVFDVRFLDNPYYDPQLRPLTGLDTAVAAHIAADPGFPDFFQNLTGLLGPLLPRYAGEGKRYLTIAIGCTGGRHRSVFTARRLADWLGGQGFRVALAHRDIDRKVQGTPPALPVPDPVHSAPVAPSPLNGPATASAGGLS